MTNGCNSVSAFVRAAYDKTKAGVRFEYPAMNFNYSNQHLREAREECELLRLRR